ncbi:MAG TPA: hypothetical protein VH518_08700, partial [Tepidisphaeraceae bacterium]
MAIRIREIRLYQHPLRTRFPFRYGIATMTDVPHLMLVASVEVDGKLARGVSADNLVPKWFTKDPNTTPQQDVEQMLATVRRACRIAQEMKASASVFEFWRELYERRVAESEEPPL